MWAGLLLFQGVRNSEVPDSQGVQCRAGTLELSHPSPFFKCLKPRTKTGRTGKDTGCLQLDLGHGLFPQGPVLGSCGNPVGQLWSQSQRTRPPSPHSLKQLTLLLLPHWSELEARPLSGWARSRDIRHVPGEGKGPASAKLS